MRPLLLVMVFACSLEAASGVEIWSGAELKGAAEGVAREAGTKGMSGRTVGAASVWRRTESGQAELHRTKTDLMVIEQGSATLVFGGTIPEGRVTQPNEVRGKAVVGGEERKLGPGDVVRIPAGTPHQFVLEKGQTVTYFALKLAK